MRKPTRVVSFILTVILMIALAATAVAADKETSVEDLTGYITAMETETEIKK